MNQSMIQELGEFIAKEMLNQTDRTINADESLIGGGLIDSFSLIDLALFVEETYGVRIDDTELNAETFDTLNQLAKLIDSRN